MVTEWSHVGENRVVPTYREATALAKLAEACESDGDIEEVTRVLARAITLEPYAEHTYRQLMIASAKLGRATDITRAYRELEGALSEGLDAEPSEETAALKHKLGSGTQSKVLRRALPIWTLPQTRLSSSVNFGRRPTPTRSVRFTEERTALDIPRL